MFTLLGFHLLVAAGAVVLASPLKRGSLRWCTLAPAATFIWALTHTSTMLEGGVIENQIAWVPGLDLALSLRMDGFAWLMVLLISGIGTLVLLYSSSYFSNDARSGRLGALLCLFAASMLGLVLAEDLIVLFVFWELTGITSYLLIGFPDNPDARAAASRALIVTTLGGFALLAGAVLLGLEAGTTSIPGILQSPPEGTAVTVALLLLLVGAATKSAQVPFQFWLPGAMAAATPVSAYLHSATMVKAGIYLVARLSPAFAETDPLWRPSVLTIGALTMVVGGLQALRQHDLKLLLAHGTVSQLGFMMLLVGAGTPALTFAGVAVLVGHALFKSALFLVIGIVDQSCGTRDLRRLGHLAKALPLPAAIAALSAASMIGLPPVYGFLAKEAALEGLLHDLGGTLGIAVVVAVALGSVLTTAYAARLFIGPFLQPIGPTDEPAPARSTPAPLMVTAILPLAAGTVVLSGLFVRFGDGIAHLAGSLDADAAGEHLVLWHGFTPALGISLGALALGATLYVLRSGVARTQARLAPRRGLTAAYDTTIAAVPRVAARYTNWIVHGPFAMHIGIIIGVAVLSPGLALAWHRADVQVPTVGAPLEIALGLLITLAALGAALNTRRITSVLCLGAAGFGIAALFVTLGAPDLALTQFLVETVAVVILVLVVRRLPDRFESQAPRRHLVRAAFAGAVGAVVTIGALAAGTARTAEPISDEFVARALPEAGGRNVVNVILTDFRGFDTLGEIVVIAMAALGAIVLVGRQREDRDARRLATEAIR